MLAIADPQPECRARKRHARAKTKDARDVTDATVPAPATPLHSLNESPQSEGRYQKQWK